MVKALGHTIEVKVQKNGLYLLPPQTISILNRSGSLHDVDVEESYIGRIAQLNKKENRIILYIYKLKSNIAMEYDTAGDYLVPIFYISDVAKMLNRAPDTIRKYERQGIVPKCPQYYLGQRKARLYSLKEITELAEAFSKRRPVGRPGGINPVSKINQKDLFTGLLKRYKKL